MQALLDVILPVFLVIGFGYTAVYFRLFSDAHVDGLTKFTQNFAIPCLLFGAISTLDLSRGFDPALMGSFYTGAFAGFFAGLFGARLVFGRPWEDSVAIGFCCMFSNSVLLGLPISERAFGPDALDANYAIIAIHAPVCYGVGVTAMELARNRGRSLASAVPRILNSMFRNALVIGIALGFVVNISDIPIPGVVGNGVELISRAALPTALFALGGVLVRYRPEGDVKTILFIAAVSLILHPAIVWTIGNATGLDRDAFRSAVLTASMAPGMNAYIFASMYGVATRVVASSVLVATAASIVTAWAWLIILP